MGQKNNLKEILNEEIFKKIHSLFLNRRQPNW